MKPWHKNLTAIVIFLGAIIINLLLPVYSQSYEPHSVQELQRIQQEALNQIDAEYQKSVDALNERKMQEIDVIDSTSASFGTKEKLKKSIENKYMRLIENLNRETQTQKQEIIDYYSSLKASIHINTARGKQIFVEPQKLIGNWFIIGYRLIGTLRFGSSNGKLVNDIHLFMYNKWEDLYNLTYDGTNIAFDYENPYGVKLHFEGFINPTADLIKGQLTDLKTGKIYSWKARRTSF